MRLLDRFRSRPRFTAPLAPETPFAVIGDVHGCRPLVDRMLATLDETLPPGAPIVFVGDYVDRGESSAEVVALLHELQQTDDRVICLKGNHEAMMLSTLDAPEVFGRRWLRHGGLQTLASFGVQPVAETGDPAEWAAMADRLGAAIGPEREAWLRALPTIWQSGNVAVTHAGADPARALADQSEDALLWGHPDFAKTPRTDGTWVVHGHVIVDEPYSRAGRIATDTGAYATGCLTAAIVGPDRVEFLRA